MSAFVLIILAVLPTFGDKLLHFSEISVWT